jgi:hypothetical protein
VVVVVVRGGVGALKRDKTQCLLRWVPAFITLLKRTLINKASKNAFMLLLFCLCMGFLWQKPGVASLHVSETNEIHSGGLPWSLTRYSFWFMIWYGYIYINV